jgi:hypothetical protein
MDKNVVKQNGIPIPSVIIGDGFFKFVQIKGPDGEMHLFGMAKYDNHRKEFESGFLAGVAKVQFSFSLVARRTIDGFACIGGGRIAIDVNKKRVTVSDRSKVYGSFDADVVKFLLEGYIKKNMPGFSLEMV